MTNIMISQNIDLSSWDTLYIPTFFRFPTVTMYMSVSWLPVSRGFEGNYGNACALPSLVAVFPLTT